MRGCDQEPQRGTIKRSSTLFFANQKLDRGRKCFYRRHISDYPSPYGHSMWLLVSRNLTSQPYFSLALITGSLGSLLGLQQEVLCFSIHMVSTSALIRPIRGSHLCVACWSVCDRDQEFWPAKKIAWSSLQKLLIAWFFRDQRSNWTCSSWSFDFCCSEVTLTPW